MPVRQPTAKLRKNRRKGPVQAPETKVRGIKNNSGWENAMKASDRRYVVVHVLAEQRTIPAVNFKVQFSRMSSLKTNRHLIFADASIASCKALQEQARKHTNGNFPLILVFYKRKCIKAIQPDAPLPSSVMGGAYGGFFQAVKNAIDELAGVPAMRYLAIPPCTVVVPEREWSAVQAPKGGSWKTAAVRGIIALTFLSAGGAAALKHPHVHKMLRKVEEQGGWGEDDDSSVNAFDDVMEFDLAVGDDFDVDDPEDPLSLP